MKAEESCIGGGGGLIKVPGLQEDEQLFYCFSVYIHYLRICIYTPHRSILVTI